MSNADRNLLTDGEAARLVRMPPARFVRLVKAGEVPAVRLPDGEVRFLEADLWAWIERYRQPAREGSR